MPQLFYSFKKYLDQHFPFEVRKLPIQTHLGCPHRDKQTGQGGCIYCYEPAFSNLSQSMPSIEKQIETIFEREQRRNYEGKFMAYFQTGTNTYADIKVLEKYYKTIGSYDQIVALAVSTRPDCLSEDIIQLLAEYAKKMMVWLELGLQSSHNKTLQFINRGHNFECYQNAVISVQKHSNINICSHIILGLPGESLTDIFETIQQFNSMHIKGIKFHHLQVVKNTLLEKLYQQNQITVFSKEEYMTLLIDVLTQISPDVVVQRLFGETQLEYLIAPRWLTPKVKLIQELEKQMKMLNLWQGKHYSQK